MRSTLCPSFHVLGSTEYETCIQHSGLELPIAAFIPLLTPAWKPLQEAFKGIDDEMNSTFGSLTGCPSGEKTRRFYRARRLEWKVEKPKTTASYSWMHGGHVEHFEHFEFSREHFGKPSRCMRIVYHAFPTCRKFSNVISPAHGIQCC